MLGYTYPREPLADEQASPIHTKTFSLSDRSVDRFDLLVGHVPFALSKLLERYDLSSPDGRFQHSPSHLADHALAVDSFRAR